MFPNYKNAPACLTQKSAISAIVSPVPFNLRFPISITQTTRPAWELPAMPEVAMHEYYFSASWEHKIWTPR